MGSEIFSHYYGLRAGGEFERAMILERVNAGLANARAKGTRLGRPSVSPAVAAKVHQLRATGMGKVKIGKTLGIATGTVQRLCA